VYFGADPCFLAKVERLKPFWYRWLRRYRQLAALERAVFEAGRPTQILQLTPWEIPIYKKYYGTEPSRFHLLPANATRRAFDESNRLRMRHLKREEQGWDPEDLLLILVGSDFRRKGLDRILRGLASLPAPWRQRCRLAVLGQCSPGRFSALARRLGLGDRVHFMGGRLDAPDWMLAADLMVHPAYVETAGAVLVEALTAGLPVLTTAVCGYAFHIEAARAGRVLPDPFQQADFNQALAEMVRSPEDRARWRVQALDYASRENIYDCHEQVANIIEETTRRKLARSGRVG
jgi:UDP-glucose:(heptosyl)LPS alpha-1,3-glucosyltransferase